MNNSNKVLFTNTITDIFDEAGNVIREIRVNSIPPIKASDKLLKQIKEMINILYTKKTGEEETSFELAETLQKELENLNYGIEKLTNSNGDIALLAQELIWPSIVSISVATKYYIRKLESSSESVAKSTDALQLDLPLDKEKKSRRTEMLNEVVMFVKNCSALGAYLKTETVQQKVVVDHIVEILKFIKIATSEPDLGEMISKSALSEFLEVIHKIRNSKTTKIDIEISDALVQCMIPLSRSIKTSVLKIYKMEKPDHNSMDSLSKKSNLVSPGGSYASSDYLGKSPEFDSLPLHYEHELFAAPKYLSDSLSADIQDDDVRSESVENSSLKASYSRLEFNLNLKHEDNAVGSTEDHFVPKELVASFFCPNVATVKNKFGVFQIGQEQAEKRSSVFKTLRKSLLGRDSSAPINEESPQNEITRNRHSKYGSMGQLSIASSDSGQSGGSAMKVFKQSLDTLHETQKTASIVTTSDLDDEYNMTFMEFYNKNRNDFKMQINENTIILTLRNDESTVELFNHKGHPRIRSGSVKQILDLYVSDLISDESDTFGNCIILTYRHQVTAEELINACIENFKTSLLFPKLQMDRCQSKLVGLLILWIETYWDDFKDNAKLLSGIETITKLVQQHDKNFQYYEKITSRMRLQSKKAEITNTDKDVVSIPNIISNVGFAEFTSFNPQDIAEQITKNDFDFFKKISPLHLVNQIWGPSTVNSSVSDWTAYFNKISFWSATEICTAPILKNRILILENMIKVLTHLHDLNNFNAIMAIISGLNLSSVRRLKKTWDGVNRKLIGKLHHIEGMMDPKQNYIKYRKLFDDCVNSNEPMIPFIGLVLKHLTFANDGNPKFLTSPSQLNFAKNWAIYDITETFTSCQLRKYNIPDKSAVAEFCSKLVALPEKRLHKYSLLCEPRESEETAKPKGIRNRLSSLL